MPNEIALIIALLIIIPLGLLALLITALVMASQARREVRQLREYVDILQRDTNGQFESLRRRPGTQVPDRPLPFAPPSPLTPPTPPTPSAMPVVPPVPVIPSESLPTDKPLVQPPSGKVASPVNTSPVSLRPPMPPPQSGVVTPVAKPTRTLEERLGTQLPIWIGAIALGIGGIWLAKYMFDHAVLGPTMRVVAGSAFGVLLLAVGAWGHKRNRHIAAAVVAAGIADMYGWVFAAASMYRLIPMPFAFAVMIAITALAVGLSLRQGPIVAIVGMVGAFLTPVLLRTGQANAGVFAYLFLLQIGLLVVTRRKGWWPLAALTLVGSLLWAGGWVIGMMWHTLPIEHGKWVALFMLGSAASMVFGADSDTREAWPLPGVGRIFAWIAMLASLVILSFVVQVTQFAGMEWALMGVLAGGCMALGRIRRQYEVLAWLAEAAVLLLMSLWAWQVTAVDTGHHTPMRWATLAFGLLFTVGPYICAWGRTRSARWFGLSAGSAIAWFTLAYYAPFPLPLPWQHWWMVSLAGAVVLVAMSVPVHLRRATIVGGDESLAWQLIGVSVMLAVTAALSLSHHTISLAWAMEVPAIALIGCRLRVPRLKWMSFAVAAGVLVRLVLNPHVLDYPISDRIIFNWLSYGYGLPIIVFALAAWIYHRHKQLEAHLELLLEGGAILLGFVLVCLQVRHGFHPASFRDDSISFIESSTYINGLMVFSLALLAGASRWGRNSIAHGGAIIGVITLGALAAMFISPLNPLIGDVSVGSTVVFNWLLYAFGLPIVWCLAASWVMRKRYPQSAVQVPVVALMLLFILVSLQIRHGFHPQAMKLRDVSLVELATYCIAWFALGATLFAASRKWAGNMLQTAGLAVGIIAMITVFVGLLVSHNPWWADESIGSTRIFNWLLYAYGLPMILAGTFAWLVRYRRQAAGMLAGIMALVLLWLLVTLQVRHWFVGELLNGRTFTKGEQYTYSVAWILLGLGLLAAGIMVRGKLVRFGSLAVMLLAVFKVFIFDTRHLEDLYRVFSFIGLGVSLLVLAFCYQRFVFRRPARPPVISPDSTPTSDSHPSNIP